jgi:hypothetical protein
MENRNNDLDALIEDMKNMLDSTALVTARMIDSVISNSQLASSTTPEMQNLFRSWLEFVAGEVKRKLVEKGDLSAEEIQKTANDIGITTNTLLSLVLYLQRKGDIRVDAIRISPGSGLNTEVCHH